MTFPDSELVGERVALSSFREDLSPLYVQWMSDPEVAWNVYGEPPGHSSEEVRGWLERFRTDPMTRLWLLSRLDEARPIGLVALSPIDLRARSAEFRTLIGEVRDRGQGFGRESSELVIRHAFDDFGLREVYLHVYGYNAAGIRLYERLGFREVSRRPMEIERDGRRWDEIRMSMVRPKPAASR